MSRFEPPPGPRSRYMMSGPRGPPFPPRGGMYPPHGPRGPPPLYDRPYPPGPYDSEPRDEYEDQYEDEFQHDYHDDGEEFQEYYPEQQMGPMGPPMGPPSFDRGPMGNRPMCPPMGPMYPPPGPPPDQMIPPMNPSPNLRYEPDKMEEGNRMPEGVPTMEMIRPPGMPPMPLPPMGLSLLSSTPGIPLPPILPPLIPHMPPLRLPVPVVAGHPQLAVLPLVMQEERPPDNMPPIMLHNNDQMEKVTDDTTKITLLEIPLPAPIETTLAPQITHIVNNNNTSMTTTTTTTMLPTPHIIQEPMILTEPCVIQAGPSVSSFPIIPLGLTDSQSMQIDANVSEMRTATTVFIGDISDKISDTLVRQLLQECGNVKAWKRVQGATRDLQAFGFCEFADQDSTLRALRLLSGLSLGGKKLVIKVADKSKPQFLRYIENSKRAKRGLSPLPELNEEIDTSLEGEKIRDEQLYLQDEDLDADIKSEDGLILQSIQSLIKQNPMIVSPLYDDKKDTPALRIHAKPDSVVDIPEIEDDRTREMVHDEILKFRHIHKERESKRIQEKEKERDRLAKEKLEKEKQKRSDSEDGKSSKTRRKSSSPKREDRKRRDSHERNRSRRSREREREKERDREREKEREKERERDKEREKERERERKEREREKEREKERLRQRERRIRSLSRSRRRSHSSSDRELDRRRLMEKDEDMEKCKFENKQKERTIAFEKKLKNWYSRERKKMREHMKKREEEGVEATELKKESKKLAKFLAEYDDEHDDPKYYKGSNYARRRRDRAIEGQEDIEDRIREKDEASEQQDLQINERSYSRDSVSMSQSDSNHASDSEKMGSSPDPQPMSEREDTIIPLEKPVQSQYYFPQKETSNSLPNLPTQETEPILQPIDTPPLETDKIKKEIIEEVKPSILPQSVLFTLNKPLTHEYSQTESKPVISESSDIKPLVHTYTPGKLAFDLVAPNKLKLEPKPTDTGRKRAVDLAFGLDDEPELETVPISKFPKQIPPEIQMDMSFPILPSDPLTGRLLNEEEKKKQTKKLISSIPTSKEEVFQYDLSWAMIDKAMMDKRIRPWINRKIVDYIGEEEQALVDFIIEKLHEKCSATSLLKDIVMVLDEDAEMFVVKMWRLMIYESEARKLGICKY